MCAYMYSSPELSYNYQDSPHPVDTIDSWYPGFLICFTDEVSEAHKQLPVLSSFRICQQNAFLSLNMWAASGQRY